MKEMPWWPTWQVLFLVHSGGAAGNRAGRPSHVPLQQLRGEVGRGKCRADGSSSGYPTGGFIVDGSADWPTTSPPPSAFTVVFSLTC